MSSSKYKYQLQDIQRGLAELELREQHPLRVYRPTQYQLPIHESSASEVLTVGGKRSGKTIAVVMEIASRILGMPIIREDGSTIKSRFRTPTPKNPGLYWVIGFDVNHIGQTLYHRLFSPGLGEGANFRIIQDLNTGRWRSYNPNFDRERYHESQLSPPLFGEHMIVPNSWHMESAAGNVFKQVRLINGATICAYPSTGDSPKKGDAVDGIWIDEDIERGSYLKEWQDRLATTRGWLMWSVWPQVANEALIKTIERAKRYEPGGDRETDNPPIQVFRLVSQDNPYSDRDGLREMLERMDNDDDEAHRNQGDISAFISSRQMYHFGDALHVVRAGEFSETEQKENDWKALCAILKNNPRRLPRNWTRYLVIDPSHTRTACLVGVVPPPQDFGQRLIIEEEIIVKKHTPAMFAQVVAERVGDLEFEAFIMDQMIGRQTTVGADATVFQIYSEEFRKKGLRSRVTDTGFIRGSNDKAARRRTVRSLMEPTERGWPRLLFSQLCPLTIREVRNFRKKMVKDTEGNEIPTDDGEAERVNDCVMCHDSETDVLTNEGWKRFADLRRDESLATVNLTTNKIEYQVPTKHFVAPYSGDMVKFGGMKLDALVTPNHRMVVYKRLNRFHPTYQDQEPLIKEAGDLTPMDCLKLTADWDGTAPSSPLLIPKAFNGMGLEKEIDQRLFAEFMGWYIAEGSCDATPKCPGNGYRINIAQHKLAGIVALQPLLEQLPWKWTRHKAGFSCSSKQLWEYLSPHGNCYIKRVPQWIKDADKETIRRFMVGAVAGDGCVISGRRQYTTTSSGLAGDMQELFLKLGVSSGMYTVNPGRMSYTKDGRTITSRVTCYQLREKVRPAAYLANHAHQPNFSSQQYEGIVYCASVPNQTLITRRNGSVLVSGNCVEYLAEYIAGRFREDTAYMAPRSVEGRGSSAYHRAQYMLNQINLKQGGKYVHFGPGEAA